tara:strand:+ start:6027 stop:7334 length:1308 start_codon:yes stop_codon:yes gene_type:complete
MASTGLLGINPFRGGNVAIDISSRPTQLSIGLMQKQQAKAEAVDKYFKDWEKSINPAGLSKAEVDIFAKKLKEVQEFGIKNKQAITNPSKYGYDAQSTLMAGFKDLQSFVDQGKQATAERKAFKDFINTQIKSGKRVSDNYLDVLNKAMLPVSAGYVPPDVMQVDIYDPHDEKKFTTNVWGGIKLPTKEVFEKEIINNKPTGKVIKKTYETLDDNTVKNAMLGAINEYKTSKGTREHFDELFKDKDFTSQINENFRKRFNKDISSGSDLAVGYALTQKPGGLIKSEAPDYDWQTKFNKTQAAINSRAADDDDYIDPVETYLSDARSGKTFAGTVGENIEIMNLPEIVTKDLGKNKKAAIIGRGVGDGNYYNIFYQKDNKGNPTELIDWGKTERIPESQIRASVVSRALPSSAKAKLIRGSGGAKTKTGNKKPKPY